MVFVAYAVQHGAIAPDVLGGDDFGSEGLLKLWSHPTEVKASDHSCDLAVAGKLWTVSEDLTGVEYHWPERTRNLDIKVE